MAYTYNPSIPELEQEDWNFKVFLGCVEISEGRERLRFFYFHSLLNSQPIYCSRLVQFRSHFTSILLLTALRAMGGSAATCEVDPSTWWSQILSNPVLICCYLIIFSLVNRASSQCAIYRHLSTRHPWFPLFLPHCPFVSLHIWRMIAPVVRRTHHLFWSKCSPFLCLGRVRYVLFGDFASLVMQHKARYLNDLQWMLTFLSFSLSGMCFCLPEEFYEILTPNYDLWNLNCLVLQIDICKWTQAYTYCQSLWSTWLWAQQSCFIYLSILTT